MVSESRYADTDIALQSKIVSTCPNCPTSPTTLTPHHKQQMTSKNCNLTVPLLKTLLHTCRHLLALLLWQLNTFTTATGKKLSMQSQLLSSTWIWIHCMCNYQVLPAVRKCTAVVRWAFTSACNVIAYNWTHSPVLLEKKLSMQLQIYVLSSKTLYNRNHSFRLSIIFIGALNNGSELSMDKCSKSIRR